jgi:hypothetical protein
MSSVLPVIIDPEISEDIENEEKSLNVEINDEEVFSEEEEEEQLPEVKPKVKIEQEVIFQEPPSVKPVAKKKRVMSEAKLKQLADARAKANAKRKANKEARLKAKAEVEQKTQQIIEQKQEEYVEQKVSKIKKQIDKEPVIIQKSSVSAEDIENIVGNAISKYDNDRIKRKEEKKKAREQAEKHKKINATIKKAQGQPLTPQESGYFDSCFG